MLLLFDIDGTLLLTRGAGIRAMTCAARELFGPAFSMEGIEYAGNLDPRIYRAATERNGIEDPDRHHDAFRAGYRRFLEQELAEPGVAELLPGVAILLDRLEAIEEVTLGLVTGNYPETGRLKIERAGIDPDRFKVAGWGDDGAIRRDLPPVAARRHAERAGAAMPPERCIIIGDTVHDVDCGRAHGFRVLGVATGPRYGVEDLREAGADLVLEDLSRTDEVVAWLTNA